MHVDTQKAGADNTSSSPLVRRQSVTSPYTLTRLAWRGWQRLTARPHIKHQTSLRCLSAPADRAKNVSRRAGESFLQLADRRRESGVYLQSGLMHFCCRGLRLPHSRCPVCSRRMALQLQLAGLTLVKSPDVWFTCWLVYFKSTDWIYQNMSPMCFDPGWRQNIDRFGKLAGQWGQQRDSQLSDGLLNENGMGFVNVLVKSRKAIG